MNAKHALLAVFLVLVAGAVHADGPYPTLTGISAAADDASTAGKNPAGATRFDSRATPTRLGVT